MLILTFVPILDTQCQFRFRLLAYQGFELAVPGLRLCKIAWRYRNQRNFRKRNEVKKIEEDLTIPGLFLILSHVVERYTNNDLLLSSQHFTSGLNIHS